ncbi:hypothetical protein PENARI_c002G08995 [Penicillium arizonense]|uniref:Zn(2)-C6 fungal-type domain-containing protein n=1 Tax=Penicillium arizonense TaxID=1835702 RepID=A0A1F5LVM9_PENAI|nr:hypothetical protein PENARI_c002G08995 [Penicillium arizonense]OGE57207.1 hypothetical protein PENARI_c002G08995 [Penicillium arizonense]
MPLRRSHAKSHHGCAQCKKRRIKCDEARPCCGPCQKKYLSCTFNSSHPEHLPLWGSTTAPQSNGSAAILPLGELKLLHHWHTAIALSLAQNEALIEVFQTHVPHKGLNYPFVMHSILAISAIHLSRKSPDSRQRYTEVAIQHHSLALSLCAPLLSHMTSTNCHALFACSLLISSFSFAYQGLNLVFGSTNVNEVIEVFKLVRGTASIVENARPWIEQGDLRLLLKLTRCGQQRQRSKQVHEVHAQLKALFEQQADDGQSQCQDGVREVVLRSIKHLLHVFDACVASENQSPILAWPAIIDSEYLDLVLIKEPRSLVTLAHYGALLHVMDKAWWMEGWGKILVNLAAEYLDTSVQSEIAWPLAVIDDGGFGE